MSDLFGKQLRKQTARAKEKLLEGLGKAKATQDDVFDQHAANLSRQSKACERLNRDLKAYAIAMKALVQTQKVLRETVRDLYEHEWPDREHLCAITQSIDLQWDEFEKVVNDQLIGSVTAYTAQFPDLKTKVAKRGRKLVDFDSARNNYATIKASSKKGDDDPKVVKAATDLQQAETMYKELNGELVDVLPAAYDSRITFFVDSLQTFFDAESTNFAECAKYNKSLVALLDNLGNAFESLRVPRGSDDDQSLQNANEQIANPDEAIAVRPKSEMPTPMPRQTSPPRLSTASLPLSKDEAQDAEAVERRVYPSLNASPPQNGKLDKKLDRSAAAGDTTGSGSKASLNPFDEEEGADHTLAGDQHQSGDEAPAANVKTHSSALATTAAGDCRTNDNFKVSHKVRATHRYAAEDTDEITFDAGEVISVLEAHEEDLLDDGWLLGIKQSDGARGVFPANFTKPV